MADRIHADSEWLNKCARDLMGIEDAISHASSALAAIKLRRDEGGNLRTSLVCSLRMTDSRYAGSNAADDIRQLHLAAKALSGATGALGDGAGRAARLFEDAERKALDSIRGVARGGTSDTYESDRGGSGGTPSEGGADGTQYDQGVIKAMGYPSDPSKWTEDMREEYRKMIEGGTYYSEDGRTVFNNGDMWVIREANGTVAVINQDGHTDEVKVFNPDGTYITRKVEDVAGSEFKKSFKRPSINPRYDKDGKEIGYEGPKMGSKVFETGKEYSDGFSFYHDEKNYVNGKYSNTTTVDAGKFAFTAGGYAGLYRMTKDGDKVFSPGVRGEVGASVSSIEVNHTGKYAVSDDVSLNYGASVKGPSASAIVSGELGFIDGRPAAHVGASAEAIVGEVSAEGGATIYGVDAKVKGSVNFGVGAHADIGYHKGKFTFDAGASLGVGGSVKLEVDCSEAVESAIENVKETYNNAKKTVKAVKGFCKSIFG